MLNVSRVIALNNRKPGRQSNTALKILHENAIGACFKIVNRVSRQGVDRARSGVYTIVNEHLSAVHNAGWTTEMHFETGSRGIS